MFLYSLHTYSHEEHIEYYLFHEQKFSEDEFIELCLKSAKDVCQNIVLSNEFTFVQHGDYRFQTNFPDAPRTIADILASIALRLINDHGFRPLERTTASCDFFGWQGWNKRAWASEYKKDSPTARLLDLLESEGLLKKMHDMIEAQDRQMYKELRESGDEEGDDEI